MVNVHDLAFPFWQPVRKDRGPTTRPDSVAVEMSKPSGGSNDPTFHYEYFETAVGQRHF